MFQMLLKCKIQNSNKFDIGVCYKLRTSRSYIFDFMSKMRGRLTPFPHNAARQKSVEMVGVLISHRPPSLRPLLGHASWRERCWARTRHKGRRWIRRAPGGKRPGNRKLLP